MTVSSTFSGEAANSNWLFEPSTLLAFIAVLPELIDTRPELGRLHAAHAYWLVADSGDPIGLDDERDYFLGMLAMLAGTACRHLGRRPEAWMWFGRSASDFARMVDPGLELCRLRYQELAETMEERQVDLVLEVLPSLEESFRDLGMTDDALKCRFLEGLALMETDELPRAADVFHAICREAETLGNDKLLATAYADLAHVYGAMGDAEGALKASRLAIPMLQRLNDRIVLAKLHWGLASLLREKGHLRSAVDAYREARAELEWLGMRADVAALSLAIADVLLELDQKAEALREISAALPIIDELHMTQEGMAALTLLRESARNEIDRAALRELYRSFREPQP